jgi:ABC-type multidrug transport system fused ATPase/permease subunit
MQQLELLGSHTEETLSAIKLVISFAQEDLSNKKYDEICEVTRNVAVRASQLQGTLSGCFMMLMFGFFLYSYSMASYLLEYK